MASEGKEIKFEDLPEWKALKVKKLPMVWTIHHRQASFASAQMLFL